MIDDDLDDLDRWVRWLANRYQIDTSFLPDCWYRHGQFIEELTALRSAWQHAYSPDARPEAPMHWHEAFDHARRRLKDGNARLRCRGIQHHEPEPRDFTRAPEWPGEWLGWT